MEDFDILYLIKTPFYMGDNAKVPTEAQQCEVNEEDQLNTTNKNLILVRALTAMNDMEKLKVLI